MTVFTLIWFLSRMNPKVIFNVLFFEKDLMTILNHTLVMCPLLLCFRTDDFNNFIPIWRDVFKLERVHNNLLLVTFRLPLLYVIYPCFTQLGLVIVLSCKVWVIWIKIIRIYLILLVLRVKLILIILRFIDTLSDLRSELSRISTLFIVYSFNLLRLLPCQHAWRWLWQTNLFF